MEAWLTPQVIVPTILAVIAGIAWLLRLEGRANATQKDLEKYKELLRGEFDELEADLKDTRTRFFEHAANAAVHHNAEAYGEFKNALERRLLGMEGSLKDISVKLDQIRSHQ